MHEPPTGDHPRDERSREEPAGARAQRACASAATRRDTGFETDPSAASGPDRNPYPADLGSDERSREEPAAARAKRACGSAEGAARVSGSSRAQRAAETAARPRQIKIGTSGWLYPPWRGEFYPRKLPHRSELAYLSSQLNCVEINGTFYSLQRVESFRRWHEQTPDAFTFAVKGPRFVTHMKKLADVDVPLANFFASGVLALGAKLGPVLWQLPPMLGFDAQRLGSFFSRLPRSTGEAAWLARHHDERMTDRALTTTDVDLPLRHVLEVRHKSFAVPAFTDLMREHAVTVVVADTAGRWPMIRDVTADLVYVRLHGDVELYTSGYTDEALDGWAAAIREWANAGLDVQVHFDNDVKVRAPFDAMSLTRRLIDLV